MLCRLYRPHIGGVEKHVQKLSEQCVAHGHTVDVFTLPHDELLPQTEKQSGIHIHRKPLQLHSRILRHVLNLLPVTKSLQEKLVERDELWGWMLWNVRTFLRADVIHIHDVFFWYWPIRILLPWKKVFITFHGFEAGKLHPNLPLGKGRGPTPTHQAKRARQRAARWTRGCVAVGAWIEKWYGTRADATTYGAANCTRQQFNTTIGQEEKTAIQFSKSTKHKSKMAKLIFVGRIDRDTGIETYVEAIEKYAKLELDVYGHGPLEDKLNTESYKNIAFKGTTPDACFLYPTYDIACVSSYLSILEAMQCGIPVVAYANDELKIDYLRAHPMAENMAVCTSKKELESFFKSLQWEELQQKAKRAKAWADTQTWENMYELYSRLWSKS